MSCFVRQTVQNTKIDDKIQQILLVLIKQLKWLIASNFLVDRLIDYLTNFQYWL